MNDEFAVAYGLMIGGAALAFGLVIALRAFIKRRQLAPPSINSTTRIVGTIIAVILFLFGFLVAGALIFVGFAAYQCAKDPKCI